ncbi:MAG: hypothetical protein WC375_02735 [Methanomassiliicoccales archaeon]|jgi:hypothetical protein
MATKPEKINLTKSLEELNTIVSWFEDQDNVDVEVGLEKVREAAKLIKDSKGRLAEIENEFKEIEKEIGTEEVTKETDESEPSF